MQFKGAHYTFQVLPESTGQEPTYRVLREGKTEFHLKVHGHTWVEESSGVGTAFIQALGKAIEKLSTGAKH